MSEFVKTQSSRSRSNNPGFRPVLEALEDRTTPALIATEIFLAIPTLLVPAVGPTGPAGPQGPVGPPGATGPAGGLSAFGYIFNNSAETVAIEAPIAFDLNGPLLGIVHAPGDAGVTITASGIYAIHFSVTNVEPAQFTLFVNGAPVASTVYGSGAGTQQDNGFAILTLQANDILTLVNHSSAAAVTLQTLAGGTQTNVNASLLIERLA